MRRSQQAPPECLPRSTARQTCAAQARAPPPLYTVYILAAAAKPLQSYLTLCHPVDCSPPGSSVCGFSRQEYWSGLPCPPSGDHPGPGIKPVCLMSPASAGRFFTTGTTWEAPNPYPLAPNHSRWAADMSVLSWRLCLRWCP